MAYFFSTVQLLESDLGQVKEALPTDTIKFLTTANLVKGKGNEYILKALAQFDKIDNRKWHLTILGEGQERNYLSNLVRELNLQTKVSMPGYVSSRERLFESLRAADVFLFASLSEGLPRSIIEAAASGLPIISTNVGGVCDIVLENWLVPIKDSKSIAGRISHLLSDGCLYGEASQHNCKQAQRYTSDNLLKEKLKFMEFIKTKWLETSTN